MRSSGHRVLITGGSTGIGYALAKTLHAHDNHVTICARRHDVLDRAAASLPGVHAFPCDVAVESQLRSLVERASHAMGGISVLVNNAGVQRNDRYGETDATVVLSNVDEEIGTNLSGLVKLTVLAMPLLQREDEAAIVNVSSVLAIVPKRSAPVYCATKAAVHSFTKALRYQLEETAPNIKVFEVLAPGVETEMTRGRDFKKMSADDLAAEIVRAMAHDRLELRPGRTRALSALHRLSPALAHRLFKRR